MIKPLKGKKRFSNAYKLGVNFYDKPAKARVCFKNKVCFELAPDEENILFLGVSVSKRTAKKAVVRNRIKRLLRESVRHVAKEHDKACLEAISSIIIMWYYAPTKPGMIGLNEVLPVIRSLFDNICEYLLNNESSVGK